MRAPKLRTRQRPARTRPSPTPQNHGEWVSDHARYICWGLEVPGDDTEDEATDDEATDEDADAAELTAKEERKAAQAAAKAERFAAKAEQQAARAERKGGKP